MDWVFERNTNAHKNISIFQTTDYEKEKKIELCHSLVLNTAHAVMTTALPIAWV